MSLLTSLFRGKKISPPPVEKVDAAEAARVAEPTQVEVIQTTIPAEVWASSLAAQKRYRDLAAVFYNNTYHARTDTAEQKRQLAREILAAAAPAVVAELMDMLIKHEVANADIAGILIEIDDPTAAPLLRQLYETHQFRCPPAGITAFIRRHLGE